MTVRERLDRFLAKEPTLADEVFIAPGATVVGDVRLGFRSSVWYGCVLRGDINFIQIGEGTNVQDGTVVHLADDYPAVVGDYVTIGHAAVIHACVVEGECLIGMNATILDGAVVGRRSIVGAGSLVLQGMKIPPGSLVAGVPAKVKRSLSEEEQTALKPWAEKYVAVAAAHSARAQANRTIFPFFEIERECVDDPQSVPETGLVNLVSSAGLVLSMDPTPKTKSVSIFRLAGKRLKATFRPFYFF